MTWLATASAHAANNIRLATEATRRLSRQSSQAIIEAQANATLRLNEDARLARPLMGGVGNWRGWRRTSARHVWPWLKTDADCHPQGQK